MSYDRSIIAGGSVSCTLLTDDERAPDGGVYLTASGYEDSDTEQF